MLSSPPINTKLVTVSISIHILLFDPEFHVVFYFIYFSLEVLN